MADVTKQGTKAVVDTLDRIASLFQQDHTTLGIPETVAKDMAYRCDLLSDALEQNVKSALDELDVVKEDGFDPDDIGREVGGPVEAIDTDEAYMQGHFTQQNLRDLREHQEAGDLGESTNEEAQSPTPGKQASDDEIEMDAAIDYLAKVQKVAAVGIMSDREASNYVKDLTGLEGQIAELQMEIQSVAGALEAKKDEIEDAHKKMLKEFGGKLPETLKGQGKAVYELKEALISYTKVAGMRKPTADVVQSGTLEKVAEQFSDDMRDAIAEIFEAVIKENSKPVKASLKTLKYAISKAGSETDKEAGFMGFLQEVGNFFSKMFKPVARVIELAAKSINRSTKKALASWSLLEKEMKKAKVASEDHNHGFDLFSE
jgi:hypothetical protein